MKLPLLTKDKPNEKDEILKFVRLAKPFLLTITAVIIFTWSRDDDMSIGGAYVQARQFINRLLTDIKSEDVDN